MVATRTLYYKLRWMIKKVGICEIFYSGAQIKLFKVLQYKNVDTQPYLTYTQLHTQHKTFASMMDIPFLLRASLRVFRAFCCASNCVLSVENHHLWFIYHCIENQILHWMIYKSYVMIFNTQHAIWGPTERAQYQQGSTQQKRYDDGHTSLHVITTTKHGQQAPKKQRLHLLINLCCVFKYWTCWCMCNVLPKKAMSTHIRMLI